MYNKILFAFLSVMPQMVFSAEPLSYKDFMKSYIESSLSIKIKNKEIESITENDDAINYYFIPKLTITGKENIGGKDEGVSIDVGLRSTLYNAQSYYNIDKHKYDLAIAKFKLQELIDSEMLNIAENLISIAISKELDLISTKLEDEEQKFIIEMEGKEKYGLVEKRELDQAYLLKNKIDSERKVLNKQIAQFENNIELIIGHEYPSQGVYLDSGWIKSLLSYHVSDSKNINNNVKIKIIDLEINSSFVQIKQADPKLTVSIEAKQSNNLLSSTEDKYVGLNVSFTPFDFTQVSDASSKTKIYEANFLKKENAYRTIITDASKLELAYDSDNQELKDLMLQAELTQKIINSYEREYQLGNVSFFELSRTKYDQYNIEKQIAAIKIKMCSNRLKLSNLYNGGVYGF